jgi:arginyl-tRNA synthetase
MNIEFDLQQGLHQLLVELGLKLPLQSIVIEISKDKLHGDYATNVALKFAKELALTPRALAALIQTRLMMKDIEKIEIAGPGFINFFMKNDSLSSVLPTILKEGERYGSQNFGKDEKINIEFVSANPTGSMHIAHARGAALGDSMARLYEKVGYHVTREFYVNDAGNQINRLAESIYVRYLELFGVHKPLPQDGYHGEDIIHLATKIKNQYGHQWLKLYDESFFKKEGIAYELSKINQDLKDFRVQFDVFTYETAIRTQRDIDDVLAKLKNSSYVFEGATFLKTTLEGDDKDRVMIKSDGSYTYFLPDIVYHLNKIKRGFTKMIDILGPDHHGYIGRMKAAMALLGYSKDILEIEIMQLVRLIKEGQEVKMSKRTGVGVTMRELMDEVGIDAARYFFVSRSTQNPIDFDLDLAVTKSNANPVYYVQYAHARLQSLLRTGSDIALDVKGQGLTTDQERDLLKHLSQFSDEVLRAALEREPSKIVFYAQKLASYTHSFYTICRVIDRDNLPLSGARLALVKASSIVLANALQLIGVSAPESM